MIPTEPTGPTPGIIEPRRKAHQRLWDLAVRHWRESIPAYAAVVLGGAVEYQAVTEPGLGTAVPYLVTSGIAAPICGVLTAKTEHDGMAFTAGFTSAFTLWAAYQTGAGPNITGAVLLAIVTGGSYIPYGKYLAARNDAHKKLTAEVRIAELHTVAAVAEAYAIPAQRTAPPAVEAAPAAPAAREPVPWKSPRNSTVRQAVPVGPNTDIDIVGGHILVAGRTRAGKSVILNGIISSLLDLDEQDAVVVGIDMKFGGVEFRAYEHVGMRVAFNAADATALIDWVVAQAERRGERLGVSFRDTGSIQKTWHATKDEPHIVLVIDEVAELTRQAPQTAAKLETILAVTTGLGVTAILGTQLSSSGVFGGTKDGPANIDTVVCLGTASPMHTRMILGEDATKRGFDAHLLEQQGEFYVRSHRHRTPVVDRSFDQTARILEDHLHSLGRRPAAAVPDIEPEAFARPEPEAKPGRIDNATELITAYLGEHGPATAEEVHAGLGFPAEKLKSVQTLMRRHAVSGIYKRSGDGTKYSVNTRKTVTGNVVRFRGRSNA